MKRNLFVVGLAISALTLSMAEYNIRYDIGVKKDIKFVESISEPTEPVKPPIIYGDWINYQSVFDCSTWQPLRSTVTLNTSFNQNRTCSQEQRRSVTNGDVSEESQIISVSEVKNTTGTLECLAYSLSTPTGFGSYGSTTNVTGVLENPNNGTRVSWKTALIYSDLNQTKKPDKNEIIANGYKYTRGTFSGNRNITFEGYNYKSYDYSICRHILD